MRKSYLFVGAGIVGIVAVLSLTYGPDDPVIATNEVIEKIEPVETPRAMEETPKPVEPIVAIEVPEQKTDATQFEKRLEQDWINERGANQDTRDLYRKFGVEELEALAFNGDIYAMDRLAIIYYETGQSEQYLEMLEKSVASGSIMSLHQHTLNLGNFGSKAADNFRNVYFNEGFSERDLEVKKLAMRMVLVMRGAGGKDLAQWAKMDTKTPFNDEELLSAQVEASRFYDRMQKYRSELGFGEFINHQQINTKPYDLDQFLEALTSR